MSNVAALWPCWAECSAATPSGVWGKSQASTTSRGNHADGVGHLVARTFTREDQDESEPRPEEGQLGPYPRAPELIQQLQDVHCLERLSRASTFQPCPLPLNSTQSEFPVPVYLGPLPRTLSHPINSLQPASPSTPHSFAYGAPSVHAQQLAGAPV
eukprot:317884-Pyramimonas_sp.AAC.1